MCLVVLSFQVKDGNDTEKVSATETAERLLVINKPLTDLQGICINLLCDEREVGRVDARGSYNLIECIANRAGNRAT